MSGVEHEVEAWQICVDWCILDTQRNTWWVMDIRRRPVEQDLEFLLDNGQGQRAVVPMKPGHRVTMVMFTFDDRIALLQEQLRRHGHSGGVRVFEEVDDGPDSMARRVRS